MNMVFGALYLMKKGRDAENDLDPDDPNSKNWKGTENLIADDLPKPNKSQQFVNKLEAENYTSLCNELEDGRVTPQTIRAIIMHMFTNR